MCIRDRNLPYLLSILEKHTTFIPSETNQTEIINGEKILRDPDITLYDHLRTSAMIASSAFEYVKSKDEAFAVAEKDASDLNRLVNICESEKPFYLFQAIYQVFKTIFTLQPPKAHCVHQRQDLFSWN
eukprot:TRINITY_DN58232_c0_g1_i2.p1 TRINITY_DN58232_c0_g1~~TRINITY_DN58232_c0_g1_i2.p1  ORF type:complete len:128 (+),score=4.06 TRINITY_DN58232_c0_g1_i2:118-501(+)